MVYSDKKVKYFNDKETRESAPEKMNIDLYSVFIDDTIGYIHPSSKPSRLVYFNKVEFDYVLCRNKCFFSDIFSRIGKDSKVLTDIIKLTSVYDLNYVYIDKSGVYISNPCGFNKEDEKFELEGGKFYCYVKGNLNRIAYILEFDVESEEEYNERTLRLLEWRLDGCKEEYDELSKSLDLCSNKIEQALSDIFDFKSKKTLRDDISFLS